MGLGLNAMSALYVVVFQMLVGSVAADTKATTEMLTHSTTTQSRLRTVMQYQCDAVLAVAVVIPLTDHRPFYSRTPLR